MQPLAMLDISLPKILANRIRIVCASVRSQAWVCEWVYSVAYHFPCHIFGIHLCTLCMPPTSHELHGLHSYKTAFSKRNSMHKKWIEKCTGWKAVVLCCVVCIAMLHATCCSPSLISGPLWFVWLARCFRLCSFLRLHLTWVKMSSARCVFVFVFVFVFV